MNDGTILLVENDPALAEQAIASLRKEEFANEVVLARDGVEAIEWLLAPGRSTGDMPCLVMLNVQMPHLDGFGVLHKMRADERTRFIPVVMFSSSNFAVDVRSAYASGANGYVRKASEGGLWPDKVRAVARYWLSVNESPYS